MDKEYRFWNVIYEKTGTEETIRACVTAETIQGARSKAKRKAKNTEWRVKFISALPRIGEAS